MAFVAKGLDAIGGFVGKAIGSIIGGGKKATPTATVTTGDPPIMPTADDAAVKRARRRSITEQLARGGRSSTMLTSDGDKLG
jgi:hypothetical protein